MSDAHRGVVYTQKVVSDPSVAREMTALSDRAKTIQAMLGEFRLGGLDLSQFQTGVDRAHASLEALHKFALQPAMVGAPSMAPAPGVVSQLATYPAATLSPAANVPAKLPAGGSKDFKADLDKMVEEHKAAADKLANQSEQSAQARAAANGAAAKVQAQQEADLTARAAAEAEKRAALPDRVIQNRIKMLARVQKFEADKEAAERAAADKQIAQLQKTADAEQKATDKKAAAAQKAAEKDAADAEKVAARRKAQLEKETEADKKYWESFVKFGEESQKKRAEQHERDEADVERRALKVREINNRIRASLLEVGSSVTELARGFVEAGLVGEEDFDKIKDSLLKVQAAMDLVRGGLNIWRSLSEASILYAERLEKVAALEKAAAAARAAGGAASAAGSAGAGTAGVAGVAAAPLVAPAAAFIAAATAVFAAGKLISESFQKTKGDVDKFGFALESWRHTILESEVAFLSGTKDLLQNTLGKKLGAAAFNTSIFGAVDMLPGLFGGKSYTEQRELDAKDAKARADEIAKRNQFTQQLVDAFDRERAAYGRNERAAKLRERVDSEFGEGRQRFEAEADRRGLTGTDRDQFVADRAKQAAIESEMLRLAAARKEVQSLIDQAADVQRQSGASPEVDSAAADRMAEIEQRMSELAAERMETERDMYLHGIASLQQQLNLQQQQVNKAKELHDQMKRAVDDALTGFGQLTPIEQQKLMEIRRVIDKGDVSQLRRDQLDTGLQHGDDRMKQVILQFFNEQGQQVLAGANSKLFDREQGRERNAERIAQDAVQKHDATVRKAEQQGGNVTFNSDNTVTINVNMAEWTKRTLNAMRLDFEKGLKELEEKMDGQKSALERRQAASNKAREVKLT